MTQTARSRLLSASILLLATASLFSYVSLHSHSGAQTPGHAKMAHMEWREQVDAPYWSVEDGFVSTIQMKNYRVDKTVTVTPILFPLHGAEIKLDPVTLNPSETRLLNINDVLAGYKKHFTVGAAEIRTSQDPEGIFGANLSVLDASRSLIYDFQFRQPEMSSRLEGLWWFYDEHTDGFVAVQNTTDHNVEVVPTLYAREHQHKLQTIKLHPHEMSLIALRQELHNLGMDGVSQGGIQLEASEPNAVIAGGGEANPNIGFSTPLRLDDPEMQAMRAKRLGQTVHALNVAIGADDPMMGMGLPKTARMNPIMNLRNASEGAINVTPVFRYSDGDAVKSLTLDQLQLRSQEVERIDLLPYWKSGQIPARVSSGSVEISYSGKPGSLVASVTSVDQTGTYVFDSKIDNKLAAGFQGEYWSTEGENNTSITIKNITDKPATGWVTLQYDGGRHEYNLPPLTLKPGEAHMIDLKMIQMEHMRGAKGELLPATAAYGGMKLKEEPGGRHFLMDAVVFNPKTATCGVCGYGCLYPTSISMPGGTYIVALSDGGEVIAVNAHMCDGSNQTGWACSTGFSSDDTGIATVDAWCQSQGYGIGVGGTTFRGTAADVPGPHCGDQTLRTSRPANTCTKPTGETTSFNGWATSQSLPTIGKWTQTLSPASPGFSGRVVTEQDPGGGSDGCWFSGSSIAKIDKITGGTWTVTSSNTWGDDYVGVDTGVISYYRGAGRAPCTFTVPQRMVINCSTGTSTYRNNTLGYTIGTSTVSSIRDGSTQTQNWP